LSAGWRNTHTTPFIKKELHCALVNELSLKEVMVLMNGREYGRAISLLEDEASSESKSPTERAELYEWLAECHRKLEDYKSCGDSYLDAIKRVLSQQIDLKSRARQALPLSEKALESYKLGGDTVDVLEAAKLRQRLLELAK